MTVLAIILTVLVAAPVSFVAGARLTMRQMPTILGRMKTRDMAKMVKKAAQVRRDEGIVT